MYWKHEIVGRIGIEFLISIRNGSPGMTPETIQICSSLVVQPPYGYHQGWRPPDMNIFASAFDGDQGKASASTSSSWAAGIIRCPNPQVERHRNAAFQFQFPIEMNRNDQTLHWQCIGSALVVPHDLSFSRPSIRRSWRSWNKLWRRSLKLTASTAQLETRNCTFCFFVLTRLHMISYDFVLDFTWFHAVVQCSDFSVFQNVCPDLACWTFVASLH